MKKTRMIRPDEFGLIAEYFAPLAGDGSFGLKDDAALLKPKPGHDLVITQDAIAGGVHFFPDDPSDLVARKALRVNLSDLAAKGARPLTYSLALGLGNSWDADWVENFARGLALDQQEFGITLSGGDTFKTGGGFVIAITAIGEVPGGCYLSRLGAKDGDLVYVTGTIGDAALGLLVRQGKLAGIKNRFQEHLEERYLLPLPRSGFAELARKYATATMDISDGLVGDFEKLLSASGIGGRLNATQVPLSTAATAAIEADSTLLETALTGGDDYEILLTIPPETSAAFERDAVGLPFPVTRIGEIVAGEGAEVFDRNGNLMEFAVKSYNHGST